ncbi:unnamed protein product [Somion occarium]|uniref:Zn(2)-C6 fungal-type domain-containing protein n=1 Tax=Somion occarium TaxID=3059160 RepID=A0ABP1D6C5_9APHY
MPQARTSSASADPFHVPTNTPQGRRQLPVAAHLNTTTGLPAALSSPTVATDNPPQPAEGGPFTANWSASASSSSSSLPSQTHPTSNQVSIPRQPSSASMIGPPMYYDQDHAEPQGDAEFQRWVQSYPQGQFDFPTSTDTAIMSVPQMPYNPGHHSQVDLAPAPMLTMDSNAMQPQTQNQYQFMPQYSSANPAESAAFHQHFFPAQTPEQSSMSSHSAHGQVPQQSSSVDYVTQQQQQPYSHQDYSQSSVLPRHRQQQHSHSTQHQGPLGSHFYYNSHPNPSDPQSHLMFQPYTTGSDHLSVPGSYTPSTDNTAPPSSMSPSSLAGTDDGHSFHSHTSRTSPQPNSGPPSAPPSINMATTSQLLPAPSAAKRDRSTGRAKGRQFNAKRPRVPDSDSESEGDDDGQAQPTVPPLKGPSAQTRLPGACTHCKKLKMKCDFPKDENTCKRCKSSGHHCIVEGRKPRNTPNKREYLLAQIRQKDAVIESLLKQLHNPYLATPMSIASYRMATSPSDQNNQNVLAWLDRMETSVRTAGTSAGTKAFQLDSRTRPDVEDDSDDESDDANDDPTERGTVVDSQEREDANNDDEKLFSIPDATVPIGLIANLSLGNKKKTKAKVEDRETDDDDDLGVANRTYFAPGPAYDLDVRANLIEQYSPPEIIVHGLVTPDDVTKLFEIFYARLNVHVSLLDPVLHTPQSTFARCPFLFTVVCAVSSRFYAAKSEIYPIAMHFAKHAAANAMITGWKSVELAQAYILLSIFGVPAKRWEEDRSWLYIGLAIRLATDLNVQRVSTVKPTSEQHEREILNRTRLWINCYNLDRSLSTQYGKPYSIKEDYVIRTSSDWYRKSKYNDPLDVGLCGYNALLRIVARFHDEVFSDPSTPSGLNERVNFLQLAQSYDTELSANHDEWHARYTEATDLSDPAYALRMSLLPFVTSYARLVMYSFAFQHAFKRGLQPDDRVIIDKVIRGMVHDLAPSGFMRYSPDGHFVFATFASAFLLKLLRRDFTPFITNQQRDEIFDLIGGLIDVLNSPEIAIDERHTPRLHARFLAQLLSKHRRNVVHTETSHSQNPPQGQTSGGPPGPHPIQPIQSSTSGAQIFSTPQAQGGTQGGQNMGHSQGTSYRNPSPPVIPVTPTVEPGYTSLFDPTEFGSEFEASYGEEMFPGALQIFKNPTYWQNALMPGFTWPETRSHEATQYQGYPGVPSGFSSLQAAAVSMG